MDGKAIQSAIREIMPLMGSTCDMVHYLIFAFLVALSGFHPLLFTQLTADLTLECSDGSMFHPLSHTA